ncbi:hypothetical protein Tco_0709973 [Tanacetum coccineum]
MASEQFCSGLGLQLMTPTTSSSGLVPNPIPQQPCNPPKIQVVAAPRAVDIGDSPVSTSINLDAPSTSIPSRQEQEHSLIISQGVEESPKIPLFHDYESLHEDSTSQGLSSVGIKRLHKSFCCSDNAASSRVTTADKVTTAEKIMLTEKMKDISEMR